MVDVGSVSFMMEESEVKALLISSGLPTIETLLSAMVAPAKSLAKPPISGFYVGAVGLGFSGRVYLGVNLEFAGVPLNNTVHAEQFLVANAASHGEHGLRILAVSAAPCGHCRQFLQELRNAPDLRIIIADADAETQSLGHFLPHRFGPHDVLAFDFPLLMEPRNNGLSMESSNGGGDCDDDLIPEVLRDAALAAANRSHAPYTNSPAGVALMTVDGAIYSGYYMESVAYNPGLPPLQAALVSFVAGGGQNYHDIVQAVLVEKNGTSVQFADTVQLLLKKISPKCKFHVFDASHLPTTSHCLSFSEACAQQTSSQNQDGNWGSVL